MTRRIVTTPKAKSNEMEEREGTPEEVAEIAGAVGLVDQPAPPLIPYAGDREEDQPDRPDRPQPSVTPLPTTLDAITERMEKALAGIETRAKDADSDGQTLLAMAMLQLAEGLKAIKEGQVQAAHIIANMQRATTAPENKFFPDISAFNVRGEKDFKRPTLRCEYFLPWPIKPGAAEELTREEVELLNLVRPGEHMVQRADRTKVKIHVHQINKLDSDDPSRIVFNHDTAFNNDYHRLMPFDWIRQVVESNPKTRAAAQAVLTMEEEEALILARKFNDGREALADEAVVSVGA